MKRVFFPLLFLFIIDGVIPQTQVNELLTENLTLPIGLDVSIPRFTWLLDNNTRNIIQTAYEIEVKSDNLFVWRSGKVISDSHRETCQKVQQGCFTIPLLPSVQ